jgi:hypothetical protein
MVACRFATGAGRHAHIGHRQADECTDTAGGGHVPPDSSLCIARCPCHPRTRCWPSCIPLNPDHPSIPLPQVSCAHFLFPHHTPSWHCTFADLGALEHASRNVSSVRVSFLRHLVTSVIDRMNHSVWIVREAQIVQPEELGSSLLEAHLFPCFVGSERQYRKMRSPVVLPPNRSRCLDPYNPIESRGHRITQGP